jgi:hypothetical protein
MARKTRDPNKIVRDWKGRFARTAGHKQSSNTKALRKGISERRVAVAAAAAESRNPRPVNRVEPKPQIRVDSRDQRVSTEKYGMRYSPSNEKIVERARAVSDSDWDKLSIETLPARFPLQANEETIKLRHVAKVVNGEEPFREGYITKLWRAPNGDLHIADGHTRAAMYYALDKPMPVRIMDEKKLAGLTSDKAAVPTSAHKYPAMESKLTSGAWKVDSKGYVNDVAAFSSDAKIRSEDNPGVSPEKRKEALAVAEDYFTKAVDAAPEVRRSMRSVVAAMRGNMEREYDPHSGEPTAAKQLHSIYRKIQLNMLEKKVDDPRLIELKDTVRFSATFGEEDYAKALPAMRKALIDSGCKQIKPPLDLNDGNGGWELGAYRGINFAFEDKNGVAFEVQIHTKASVAAAEDNHNFYDISRKTEPEVQELMDSGKAEEKTGVSPKEFDTPQAYVAELNRLMYRRAEQIPVPAGVSIIKTVKENGEKRSLVVRTTEGTEYVSASDGRKILKPPKW